MYVLTQKQNIFHIFSPYITMSCQFLCTNEMQDCKSKASYRSNCIYLISKNDGDVVNAKQCIKYYLDNRG